MSALTPYLALATFPTAWILASFSNIVELSWGFHHGLDPKPKEVRDKADAINRYVNFLRDCLLLAFIAIFAQRNSVPPARLGLHLHAWKTNVVLGITVAFAFLVLQALMNNSLRYDNSLTHDMRRGSSPLWVSIFFVGAFSEELWVALCLVTLTAAGYSPSVSIALVAVVFAALHYQYYIDSDRRSWAYRFGGALGITSKGVVSALLFVWTGSLITTLLFHFIGNLGSLYWARGAASVNPRVSSSAQ